MAWIARLDHLNAYLLMQSVGMTLDDIASSLKEAGHKVSKATLSTFFNHGSPELIPGLQQVAISEIYYTSSHVAERMQLQELGLRIADATNKAAIPFLLASARKAVADERDLMALLRDPFTDHEAIERSLDRAAIFSLEGQIFTYQAKSLLGASKKSALVSAMNATRSCLNLVKPEAAKGPAVAEKADVILASRAGLNLFYQAYMLDIIAKDDALPEAARPESHLFSTRDESWLRANEVAREIGTHQFFVAAEACAKWTGDPRVALYASEIAEISLRGSKTPRDWAHALKELAESLDRHGWLKSAGTATAH